MKNSIMTHVVAGYPSFDECLELMLGMQEAGVDAIEMQIPFSDPSADGPVIMAANDISLKKGMTTDLSFELINKARNIEREKKYQEAVKEAEVSFKHYRKDPLFIAGLMLYIGEGDNKDRAKIRIANSRTSVHRIYIDFMVAYFGIERSKIRFWVLLYPDLSEGACMKYWSKALKLPYSQFYKNQVIQGKSKKRTLQFGVGNTIIVSTVLKYKLNRWIELAEKDL